MAWPFGATAAAAVLGGAGSAAGAVRGTSGRRLPAGARPRHLRGPSPRRAGPSFDHPLYDEAPLPATGEPLGAGSARCEAAAGGRWRVLEGGLAVAKGCLGLGAQRWLAGVVMRRGAEAPGRGFWRRGPSGRKEPNSAPRAGRGRIYDGLEAFPPELAALGRAALAAARAEDSGLPSAEPTHARLLHYSCGPGVRPRIQWHRDEDPNDGQGDRPILALSLGLTCTVMFSHQHPREQSGKVHKVLLESGDAYVMGGRCRHIYHSVKDVSPGTCPPELLDIVGEARLAVSFHDAPGVDAGEYAEFYTPGLARQGWDPLWRAEP